MPILAAAWLAATLWLRPLAVPDEGRYVGVAWAMLQGGDWLTPRLDGLPYFHKPPLFYWITAAAMAVFGPHEWAARAAPWAGACLATASLYLFMRRWCDARAARPALLAMLAQPLVFVGGQFANLDMLVAGLIGATILAGADAVLRLQAGLPHRLSLLAAWCCAGLGVLAKGLIGIVLPVMVLALALPLAGGPRLLPHLRRLLWLPDLLAGAAIALPWFAIMEARHPGFLDYFIVEQHVRRFAAGGFNNPMPVWFYPAILGVLALPWWPWVALALRRPRVPAGFPARFVPRLMLAWALVVTLFFSLPQSKLVGYILPAVAPLAGLAAMGWVQAPTGARARPWLWWGGNALLLAVSLAAVAVLAWRAPPAARPVGQWLAAQPPAPGQVWSLERFDFDLPFYARLVRPVTVAGDWSNPAYTRRDDWRRELADAARFDPAAAHGILASREDFLRAACAGQVGWIVASRETLGDWSLLPVMEPAHTPSAHPQDVALWRLDASPWVRTTLGCAPGEPVTPARSSRP